MTTEYVSYIPDTSYKLSTLNQVSLGLCSTSQLHNLPSSHLLEIKEISGDYNILHTLSLSKTPVGANNVYNYKGKI